MSSRSQALLLTLTLGLSTVTAAQASFIQPTSAQPNAPDLTTPALTTQALTTQALTTPASNSVDPKLLHVLNRLSFGPRPGDLERLQAIGIDRYIQEQLFPERIPEPPDLQQQLSQLQTLQASPLALMQAYRAQQANRQQDQAELARAGTTTSQPAAPFSRQAVRQEATQARLMRAIASPRQLQEVMVDVWFNHFNVDANKNQVRVLVGSYEETAIRPHALGRFRDLLEATARHPAMLVYLDNQQNSAPQPAIAARIAKPRGKRGLNENYARELMELHTLGVNGGYTQQDVTTLARILTGWGIVRTPQINQLQTNQPQPNPSGFFFDAKRHDFSDKVFLGKAIVGRGEAEVEEALDRLARHPATARHISYKLTQYFVSDQPPQNLVDRLAQRFLSSDGDIRQVLQTLFASPEFWQDSARNTKFKTPYQYVVSAVRATGKPVTNYRFLATTLQQLGMPLYGCPTPDGYKNTQDVWLNPDAMTRRLSFATTLGSGTPPILPSTLAQTLGHSFSSTTQRALNSSAPALRPALILGSPDFMRR